MGKRSFLLISLLCLTFAVKAEGYRISVNWTGIKDTTLYLAHYYDTKIFVDDTIKLDDKGKGTFEAKRLLHQGLYLLYLNEKTYLDFLLGEDQELNIQTDNTNTFQNLKITGAIETEKFLKYQNLLRKESLEKTSLQNESGKADSLHKKSFDSKIDSIDNYVNSFITKEINTNTKTMYGAFLKLSKPVDIPPLDIDRKQPKYDSIAWFYYYNYERDHYFDNVDFSDDRILFTPLFQPMLDKYFNKTILQSADSVSRMALKVIEKAKANKNVFQYVSQFLLNNSLQSKIMGMDAVFVTVADHVYLNGQATWADSTTLRKVAEQAYLIRPNIIGKVAPELVMENMEGQFESLHQLQCDYTVLVFWDPNCGHCKKEIPDLYQNVYSKYLHNNIEFFAVNTGDKKQEWIDFINKNQLVGWHHLFDLQNQSRFRYKYDVQTTPMIYLLDKNKKIIAKKIDNATLIKVLDSLLKK